MMFGPISLPRYAHCPLALALLNLRSQRHASNQNCNRAIRMQKLAALRPSTITAQDNARIVLNHPLISVQLETQFNTIAYFHAFLI